MDDEHLKDLFAKFESALSVKVMTDGSGKSTLIGPPFLLCSHSASLGPADVLWFGLQTIGWREENKRRKPTFKLTKEAGNMA